MCKTRYSRRRERCTAVRLALIRYDYTSVSRTSHVHHRKRLYPH